MALRNDQRGNVVPLRERESQIPRNKAGDPDFPDLEEILIVFSSEEVCEMVNRYLYNIEYQKAWQRKRQREESEKLKPIKDLLWSKFKVKYVNATDEQLNVVLKELSK